MHRIVPTQVEASQHVDAVAKPRDAVKHWVFAPRAQRRCSQRIVPHIRPGSDLNTGDRRQRELLRLYRSSPHSSTSVVSAITSPHFEQRCHASHVRQLEQRRAVKRSAAQGARDVRHHHAVCRTVPDAPLRSVDRRPEHLVAQRPQPHQAPNRPPAVHKQPHRDRHVQAPRHVLHKLQLIQRRPHNGLTCLPRISGRLQPCCDHVHVANSLQSVALHLCRPPVKRREQLIDEPHRRRRQHLLNREKCEVEQLAHAECRHDRHVAHSLPHPQPLCH